MLAGHTDAGEEIRLGTDCVPRGRANSSGVGKDGTASSDSQTSDSETSASDAPVKPAAPVKRKAGVVRVQHRTSPDGRTGTATARAAPLPPPGSYYEYAGQRVLVPEWPLKKLANNKAMSPALARIIRQVLTHDPPIGQHAMGKGRGRLGLSEWGKEVLLRVKAKICALEATEPTAYSEVRG